MPSLEAKPFIYSYETRLGTEWDKGELTLKEGGQWKSRRLLLQAVMYVTYSVFRCCCIL
jgi:hypothetical protein